jgi:hypothetical protein
MLQELLEYSSVRLTLSSLLDCGDRERMFALILKSPEVWVAIRLRRRSALPFRCGLA